MLRIFLSFFLKFQVVYETKRKVPSPYYENNEITDFQFSDDANIIFLFFIPAESDTHKREDQTKSTPNHVRVHSSLYIYPTIHPAVINCLLTALFLFIHKPLSFVIVIVIVIIIIIQYQNQVPHKWVHLYLSS